MIRKQRNTRDLERLAGRRGAEKGHAILWGDLEALAAKLANTSFGKAISPYFQPALNEEALESYLSSSQTVRDVEQTIDATNTYIENLVDGYSGSLSDLNDADVALAGQFTTFQAEFDAVEASVTQNIAAIATMESYAAATYTLRVDAGDAEGSLELVAADDPINGPRSAVRIRADYILLDGTVKANHLETDQLSAMFATIGLFKSAASGARVEIQDDVIQVFRGDGSVAVKIGNLD